MFLANALLVTISWFQSVQAYGATERPGKVSSHATSEDSSMVLAPYYSFGPWEPDKVVSAWLIARFHSPGSDVLLLERTQNAPRNGIPFDFPGVPLSRNATRSTYDMIFQASGSVDSVLGKVGDLVRPGELAAWMLDATSEAGRFDRILRPMIVQKDLSRIFAFMDTLYAHGGKLEMRIPAQEEKR